MHRIGTLAVVIGLLASGASPAQAAPSCFGRRPTIVGTDDDDTLRGTPGRDVIFAGRGDDIVHARGGNDLICGGSGEDRGLYGDAGNDRIDAGTSERTTLVFGGAGDDFLYDEPGGGDGQEMFGGPGDDILKAGDSNGTYIDVLDGGPGNDGMQQGRAEGVFVGGEGDDVMRGGRWNGDRDVLLLNDAPGPVQLDMAAGTMSGWGSDTIEELEIVRGGAFDDTMAGDDERNFFVGGDGDDTLSGAGDDDCLLGSSVDGGDWSRCLFPYELKPASGDDTLSGGDGDDVLTGGDGNDDHTGGPGVDTAWFASSPVPVTVDLAAGSATGEGTDVLREVEGAVGSNFADTLTGTAGADVLIAGITGPTAPAGYQGTGGDIMRGLEGDDRLDVVGGADADGGAGNDTVTYAWAGFGESFVVDLPNDSDSGDNTLTDIENVTGPGWAKVTIHGDESANVLTGQGGENELFGYGGDDLLTGFYGNDDLDGGDGTDALDGGPDRSSGYDVCLNGETVEDCDWFSA